MVFFYSKLYKRVVSNIDKIIALTFIIITILYIILSLSKGHDVIILPIIILVSSTVYLLFRDKISSDENLPNISESNRVSVITHIVFLISVTLLLWLSWSNLYYKPPMYFAFVLVAAASIIINIFYLNDTKILNIAIILIKITTLSYIIYSSIYYQFEGYYGTDSWLHNDWIQQIINIGHLTEDPLFVNSYYLFPIFHLSAAMISAITTLSSYSSLFASDVFLMAMSGIFIFTIGRTIINTKSGLLAALIVPLAANNIEKATNIIPMSLGYIFVLLIIYLIFGYEKKRVENILLIIFLSATLILTHTIAALAMLITLIIIYATYKLYGAIMETNTFYKTFSHIFIVLFLVLITMKWMQTPPGGAAFFDYRLSHLIESLQLDAQFVLETQQTIPNISYKVAVFDQAGYLILLFFSTIGSLYFLRLKKSAPNRISLVFVAGAIFILIYGFNLFGLLNILPYRWYLFLYVPLSILAVAGLLWFSNLINSKTGRLAIIMLVLLVIIFGMTTNSLANRDSPFIFNDAKRLGYTQSEFAAIDTLSNVKAGRYISDNYFSAIFPYVLTDNEYKEMMQSNKSIFIQRNYYLNNPEWNDKYKVTIVAGHRYNIIALEVVILNFMKKEYMIDFMPIMYDNGNVNVHII